jgi:hypothetical protein
VGSIPRGSYPLGHLAPLLPDGTGPELKQNQIVTTELHFRVQRVNVEGRGKPPRYREWAGLTQAKPASGC